MYWNTALCKILLTTINRDDFALSVLFAIHRTECTTGCKFTLINCFQVLWKRKKINQEEYRHCLVRRLPLNTISKCERSHLKLIATPRLFRKIWQETLQQKGKQNNKKGKQLRKRPYHFHTGGQHHLGCINTVASLQLQSFTDTLGISTRGRMYRYLGVYLLFFLQTKNLKKGEGKIQGHPAGL